MSTDMGIDVWKNRQMNWICASRKWSNRNNSKPSIFRTHAHNSHQNFRKHKFQWQRLLLRRQIENMHHRTSEQRPIRIFGLYWSTRLGMPNGGSRAWTSSSSSLAVRYTLFCCFWFDHFDHCLSLLQAAAAVRQNLNRLITNITVWFERLLRGWKKRFHQEVEKRQMPFPFRNWVLKVDIGKSRSLQKSIHANVPSAPLDLSTVKPVTKQYFFYVLSKSSFQVLNCFSDFPYMTYNVFGFEFWGIIAISEDNKKKKMAAQAIE